MASKKPPVKIRNQRNTSKDNVRRVAEIALAAIVPSKQQKEVTEFISFILESLERNSEWLDNIMGKQNNFRCVLMVGAGPNRFQLQEVIYPAEDNNIKFEVELKDSEDYDKIAIAALFKLPNSQMTHLMDYLKSRLNTNSVLMEDLMKGKLMGVSYAVLRPFRDKQFRVTERVVIGSSMKCAIGTKRKREDKPNLRRAIKKTKRLV